MFRVVLLAAFTVGLLGADALTSARRLVAEKRFDEAIATLDASYRTKHDPEVKKAIAEVIFEKGEAMTYDDSLPPRVRYPMALRTYREVLKYDPTHAKAKENIAILELIYKAMGRPVPQ